MDSLALRLRVGRFFQKYQPSTGCRQSTHSRSGFELQAAHRLKFRIQADGTLGTTENASPELSRKELVDKA
jgi:hypothetical protein